MSRFGLTLLGWRSLDAYDFRVSVLSAVVVAGVCALVALAAGIAIGTVVMPQLAERRRRAAILASGITVSQMLQRIVSLAPVGVAVVDIHRDVVFMNERSVELGLVKDRLLDDRAWLAAQRTLTTGEDGEVDLSPRRPTGSGRSGLSLRGHVRLLTQEDSRFAVVYVDDQSEHARMEATRRDFVANVSHELKTPVSAMGVLAERCCRHPMTRRWCGVSVARCSPSRTGWRTWWAS